jgi:hypothetical protein
MPEPTHKQATEILDYFGKCENCRYPATAFLVVRTLADGSVAREFIATCALPCGWQSAVPFTRMTTTGPPH